MSEIRNVAKYDKDSVCLKHKELWLPLETINSSQKRSSKKRKTYDDYISGTSVKNYILKDPLLDWLDKYYECYGLNDRPRKRLRKNLENVNYTKPSVGESGLDMFFQGGNTFEEKVNAHLARHFEGKLVTINTEGRNGITEDNFEKTKNAILQGIPIILQGVLFNHTNKTRGVTDIIIRSDYINKLVNKQVLSEKRTKIKAPCLEGNYHYLVVDIKWTTMTLCANGYNIRNDGRFPAYKGQLAIYTSLLGQIQGYTPPEAYIMAKAWKIDNKKNPDHGYNCFDILGVIDYDGFDNHYIEKVVNSINWLNDLNKFGFSWSPLNPNRKEMYPNMSNKMDAPWSKIKKDIGDKINEITEIWYVSDWNRTKAHEKGIMSWKDKRCNSSTLGITGDTKPNTIDEILEINRNPKGTLEPELIVNNLLNWQEESPVDFYVDFETLNSCFLDVNMDIQNSKIEYDMIFMIGVGYIQNGKWNFIKFVAESATFLEENKIITEFTKFISNKTLELDLKNEFVPRLFHWSNAELTNLEHASFRHNKKWENWQKSVIWVDMYSVFTQEPIVVHGALNFRLKSIGKAMYNLGYVKTKWENDGPSDGLEAMISAIKLYREKMLNKNLNLTENKIMNDIIKYNEVDCKIIWEIVSYLRTHNCKIGTFEYDFNVYE